MEPTENCRILVNNFLESTITAEGLVELMKTVEEYCFVTFSENDEGYEKKE